LDVRQRIVGTRASAACQPLMVPGERRQGVSVFFNGGLACFFYLTPSLSLRTMLVLAAVLQPIAISISYVLDRFVFSIDR
jgi:hypothetical protein